MVDTQPNGGYMNVSNKRKKCKLPCPTLIVALQ
jgi:hypothetical protein